MISMLPRSMSRSYRSASLNVAHPTRLDPAATKHDLRRSKTRRLTGYRPIRPPAAFERTSTLRLANRALRRTDFPSKRNAERMATREPANKTCDTVELRAGDVARLFDALDPLPLRSRDLSKQTEEFLVSRARELPRNQALRVIIDAPPTEAEGAGAKDIEVAFHRHFVDRTEDARCDLNELFRIGRISLAVGIGVLVICVVASRVASGVFAGTPLAGVFEEGLLILGWVANWRPLEIFLYDWWPLARRVGLYRRLAAAPVEMRADNP